MTNNKILIISLVLSISILIIGNIATVIINPEAYFFGNKLGGISATIYLLINNFIGLTIIYFLITNSNSNKIMIFTLIYFIYNIIESITTSLILFREYNFPIVFILGFLITLIMMIENLDKHKFCN